MAVSRNAKTIILVILGFVIVIFALQRMGIDAHFAFYHVVPFLTAYILPWIALYWLIRLVKVIESKNYN
ncbi:hypothetical protein LCY76_06835 [Fictibacillus sp. KIGAM418]|uniref:Uncharacterized protein n=1 Tax=Fictibacillus marinisediminis TaxID=2878389 RepID=A0A9X1XAM8_9BACL|nr:hypothetical protein [Fictibacillus marinisediminis]MCK6256310.1 hypothetical protein [Fictibacillus marinisediminis]